MRNTYSIKQIIEMLYYSNDISYHDFISLETNENKASLFIKFIKYKFAQFLDLVKLMDDSELLEALKKFNGFKDPITKRRFINLLGKVCDALYSILAKCYLPNQAQALNELANLLGMRNKLLKPYLIEQLINYCTVSYIQNNLVLYRVRDCKKEEVINNCWHTPYDLRQYAFAGRFSNPGFPCLYLADSIETCCKEVGELADDKERWIGEFCLNNNKALICMDLRIPTLKNIADADSYEEIQYILTYPLRLMCTTYAYHKSDKFAEEYLFSQILMNLLSSPSNDKDGLYQTMGVVYDSTRNQGGINFALFAKSKHIPPDPDEKYSYRLQELFTHKKLSRLNESNKY